MDMESKGRLTESGEYKRVHKKNKSKDTGDAELDMNDGAA
jgi:hypothetical protein